MDFMIDNVIDRKSEIRGLDAPAAYVRRRMIETVDTLNRAGRLQARIEVISEALQRFAHLCYLADTDGQFANIDVVTHRLLVPAPWGRAGYTRWGLRQHEATTLRRILRNRQQNRKLPPLFTFDAGMWFLNAYDYTSHDRADAYLKTRPITVTEWRKAIAPGI